MPLEQRHGFSLVGRDAALELPHALSFREQTLDLPGPCPTRCDTMLLINNNPEPILKQKDIVDSRDARILSRLQECRDRHSDGKKALPDPLRTGHTVHEKGLGIFPKFLVAAAKMSIHDLKGTFLRSQTYSVLSNATTTDLTMKPVDEAPGPTARSLPAQLGLGGEEFRDQERVLSPVSASEDSLTENEARGETDWGATDTSRATKDLQTSTTIIVPTVASATSRPPPPTPTSPLTRSLTQICRRRRRKGAHIMEYVGDKNPSESSVVSELLCEKVCSSSFYFPEITSAERMKALGIARPDTTWHRKRKLRQKIKLSLQGDIGNINTGHTTVKPELPVLHKIPTIGANLEEESFRRAKTFSCGTPRQVASETPRKRKKRRTQYILPSIQRPDLSQDFSRMDPTLIYPSLSRSLSLMSFPVTQQLKNDLQKEPDSKSEINMICYKFQPPSKV